jgi:hypothetical protein
MENLINQYVSMTNFYDIDYIFDSYGWRHIKGATGNRTYQSPTISPHNIDITKATSLYANIIVYTDIVKATGIDFISTIKIVSPYNSKFDIGLYILNPNDSGEESIYHIGYFKLLRDENLKELLS